MLLLAKHRPQAFPYLNKFIHNSAFAYGETYDSVMKTFYYILHNYSSRQILYYLLKKFLPLKCCF